MQMRRKPQHPPVPALLRTTWRPHWFAQCWFVSVAASTAQLKTVYLRSLSPYLCDFVYLSVGMWYLFSFQCMTWKHVMHTCVVTCIDCSWFLKFLSCLVFLVPKSWLGILAELCSGGLVSAKNHCDERLFDRSIPVGAQSDVRNMCNILYRKSCSETEIFLRVKSTKSYSCPAQHSLPTHSLSKCSCRCDALFPTPLGAQHSLHKEFTTVLLYLLEFLQSKGIVGHQKRDQ